MKSRTSFFDLAVLKKDITRFAPLWGIYLIGGLLVMLTVLGGNSHNGYGASNLAATIAPFSVINMIYAILSAMLLFGDLFNTRMCNALHALPVRREGWFLTHVAAGLLYSIVPHGIAVLLMAAILQEFWVVALCWWLGMTLEYIFFFGLAVFSALCTGNRFASIAVYGILNFGSLIIGWFITTIYQPLMYGIVLREEIFAFFSPVVNMASSGQLLEFDITYLQSAEDQIHFLGFKNGGAWLYICVCTVIGIGLMALALVMYRRRKLECAGDFIAVRPLGPIFAVVFTLTAGCLFALFADLFDIDGDVLFLTVGMIIGWFGSQMLLQRTVKVFRLKAFGALALLWAAMLLSIGLTSMDPLGITRYIPRENQIVKVEMDLGYGIYPNSSEYVEADDETEIRQLVAVHKDLVNDRDLESSGGRTVTLEYTLRSGRKVTRRYRVYKGSDAWNKLRVIYNTPEAILGYTDPEKFAETVSDVYINGWALNDLCELYAEKLVAEKGEAVVVTSQIRRELLDAIMTDCKEGRYPGRFDEDKVYDAYSIELEYKNGYIYDRRYLSVSSGATNTMAWFKTYAEMLEQTK